jgi:uncharacterized Zn finger protein (UPF0148 family)
LLDSLLQESKMSDEEDWTPPSEAEMKVLQAKRERSDKISKLMGDYLLKGYRMLATCCPQCSNIELQDRAGNKYCVACQEVDCQETSKDNPAISQAAADRGIAEEAFASQRSPSIEADNITTDNTETARAVTINPDLIPREQYQSLGARTRTPVQHSPIIPPVTPTSPSNTLPALLAVSLAQVLHKLGWANSQLSSAQSPQRITELVILVRECSETADRLQQILAKT